MGDHNRNGSQTKINRTYIFERHFTKSMTLHKKRHSFEHLTTTYHTVTYHKHISNRAESLRFRHHHHPSHPEPISGSPSAERSRNRPGGPFDGDVIFVLGPRNCGWSWYVMIISVDHYIMDIFLDQFLAFKYMFIPHLFFSLYCKWTSMFLFWLWLPEISSAAAQSLFKSLWLVSLLLLVVPFHHLTANEVHTFLSLLYTILHYTSMYT